MTPPEVTTVTAVLFADSDVPDPHLVDIAYGIDIYVEDGGLVRKVHLTRRSFRSVQGDQDRIIARARRAAPDLDWSRAKAQEEYGMGCDQ